MKIKDQRTILKTARKKHERCPCPNCTVCHLLDRIVALERWISDRVEHDAGIREVERQTESVIR